MYMHITPQSQVQLHWRQRSTGSGKEPESQPLTTEPEVRAELFMSFYGENEGEERDEESHFTSSSFHGIQIWTIGPGT